jgi:hypothetical protein
MFLRIVYNKNFIKIYLINLINFLIYKLKFLIYIFNLLIILNSLKILSYFSYNLIYLLKF